MSGLAFAKKFDGFMIEDDPVKKPRALAELFCEMMADEQADFFNMVAHLSGEWSGARTMQWRNMENHLTPDAREMLKEMFDHTETEAA